MQGTSRPRVMSWWPSAALFAGAAAIALVQMSRVVALWDFSYIAEHAYRISLGEAPYRDFVIPHAPLSFMLQAAILRLGGSVAWSQIVAAAMAGGTAVLTYRLVRLQLEHAGAPSSDRYAFVLALPVVVLNGYAVFPQPFYDSDCTFFLLLAIWALLSARAHPTDRWRPVVAGALLIVPILTKQNIGLPALAATLVVVAISAASSPSGREWPHARRVMLGALGGATAAALALHLWVGLPQVYDAAVVFAIQRRWPSLGALAAPYLRMDTWLAVASVAAGGYLVHANGGSGRRQTVGLVLIVLPAVVAIPAVWRWGLAAKTAMLWGTATIVAAVGGATTVARRRGELERTLPLVAVAVALGAFSSQGAADSAYGVWPWLIIAIAGALGEVLRAMGSPSRPAAGAVFAMAAILLGFGSLHAARTERLGFVDTRGSVERASVPVLRGLATPGTHVTDFERLVRWTAEHIPAGDRIATLPGEDPFFVATGRRPVWPVTVLDDTATPYSSFQIAEMLTQFDITWVIVKEPLQLNHQPWAQLTDLVSARLPVSYELDTVLPRYRILKRRSGER